MQRRNRRWGRGRGREELRVSDRSAHQSSKYNHCAPVQHRSSLHGCLFGRGRTTQSRWRDPGQENLYTSPGLINPSSIHSPFFLTPVIFTSALTQKRPCTTLGASLTSVPAKAIANSMAMSSAHPSRPTHRPSSTLPDVCRKHRRSPGTESPGGIFVAYLRRSSRVDRRTLM